MNSSRVLKRTIVNSYHLRSNLHTDYRKEWPRKLSPHVSGIWLLCWQNSPRVLGYFLTLNRCDRIFYDIFFGIRPNALT